MVSVEIHRADARRNEKDNINVRTEQRGQQLETKLYMEEIVDYGKGTCLFERQ